MNDLFSRIFRAIVSISIIAPFQEKKTSAHFHQFFAKVSLYQTILLSRVTILKAKITRNQLFFLYKVKVKIDFVKYFS